MTAAGSWRLTLSTPMGPQEMLLHLAAEDAGWAGRIESPLGAQEVALTVTGDVLAWVMDLTQPVPLQVSFEVLVEGDAMRGAARLGAFGEAPVAGERMAGEAGAGALWQAPTAAPVQVTGDSVDPIYDKPYIIVDEQRSEPEPHRYVHGGFEGTDARFSFYFPEKARYGGRFFHNTYPMATTSDVGPFPIAFEVATGDLGFTFDSGAYYVQTNLGGADRAPPADPSIGAYRVNAAAAKFSRRVAAEMYGEHRAYGYIFGGSGGAYQVIGCAENTDGVWDGFVPFVAGCSNAIPSMFTVRMHALRILNRRDRFPGILDAVEPGGSGDPYAGLDAEEAAALREATLMGFPPRGWYAHATMGSGYFSNVAGVVPLLDPTYIDDFWSKPGYLGADPNDSIHAERFQFDTTVSRVIGGFPLQLELAATPERDFADAHLVLLDGPSAGKSLPLGEIDGRTVSLAYSADAVVAQALQAGTPVRIDNSWPLALQTYHRHQVPTPDLYGWNQFRDGEGKPLYPQRGLLIGPIGAAGTAGSVPEGRIHGKMLMVESMLDVDAVAWQADWYRAKVQASLGDGFQDAFALWFVEHAQHDNPQTPLARAHAVSFAGALQQALRDLSAWVERGVRPQDTRYQVVDSQVVVPATAAERSGVQPVVAVTANGAARAEVAVGEPVRFSALVETPPGTGSVVAAEWDFEGSGDAAEPAQIGAPQPSLQLTAAYAYAKPGTYFPVLRVASQREGNTATRYARVQNIGRARVVVR